MTELMTDYHPLIARAVEGLAKNTGEARRALYERARAALVAQLRGVDPPLSESDITKERLALEEAIRKVEAEAARKALTEPRSTARPEPRPAPVTAAPAPEAAATPQPPQEDSAAAAAAAQPAAKPSARSRILGARTSSLTQTGLKGFRNVVSEVDGLGAASAKAAQTARDTRDSYVPVSRQRGPKAEDLDAAAPPPWEEESMLSKFQSASDDDPEADTDGGGDTDARIDFLALSFLASAGLRVAVLVPLVLVDRDSTGMGASLSESPSPPPPAVGEEPKSEKKSSLSKLAPEPVGEAVAAASTLEEPTLVVLLWP